MASTVAMLGIVFDRRTKVRLAAASIGSILTALVDTLGVALILPLVNLATTGSAGSAAVDHVLDRVSQTSSAPALAVLTVAAVLLFIVKDCASMAFTWWLSGFIVTERVNTSVLLMRHFLTIPYSQVALRGSPEMIRTLTDSVGQVYNGTVYGLISVISSAFSICSIVGFLVVVQPLSTLALIVYFSVAGAVFARLVRSHAHTSGEVMAEASKTAWQWVFAAFGSLREGHVRRSQPFFVRHYENVSLRAAHAQRVASFLNTLPRYLMEILFILAVGLLLLTSAASGQGQSGAVGLLALFVAAGFRLLPSITGLLGSVAGIRVSRKALELVHAEVAEARSMKVPAATVGTEFVFAHTLQLHDVGFTYPAAVKPALVGVTVEIKPGMSIAVVGGSGAGKSTLLDIVLGLRAPTTGRVTVDGVELDDVLDSWQSIVGYVPQEIFLLEMTLAENIAFDQDRRDIDLERLNRVVKQAQLQKVVDQLPEGVDTFLGERGARLSGGQRQRVGIARALYRQPQMLVFDEATSALDNETENELVQTIRDLSQEMTTIIVAHRLSTVRHCDVVLYMEDGQIKDAGTFAELRDRNPGFERLVALGSVDRLHT